MAEIALLTVVAAAMVDPAGRVLVQRRPAGRQMAGLWEFPGGKLEAGESPEAALARELAEELGVRVDGDALEPLAFASAALGGRHLLLLLYLVERWSGEPRALDAQTLLWTPPSALRELAMSPADLPLIAPLERRIMRGRGVEARAGIEPACKDLQSSA